MSDDARAQICQALVMRCGQDPTLLGGLVEGIRAAVFDDDPDVLCRMVDAQVKAMAADYDRLTAVKVPKPKKAPAKKATRKRASGGRTTPKKK